MVTDLFLIWAPTAGKIASKRLLTTCWSLSKHLRRFFGASYVVLEEGRKIETQDIYIPGATLCPLLVKGPCIEGAYLGTSKTRPVQKNTTLSKMGV